MLLIASLLNSTKSPKVDPNIYQDKANCSSVPEGGLVILLVLLKDQSSRFEVDGQSPEVVTANQRACEVWIRD